MTIVKINQSKHRASEKLFKFPPKIYKDSRKKPGEILFTGMV